MSPATHTPDEALDRPSFKAAFLGFLISNFVLTTAMVLLGSVAG